MSFLIKRCRVACLLFVLGSTVAVGAEPYVLVSDVDDTVKITNVLRRRRAVLNAIFRERVFAGMPELYRQMLGPGSAPTRLRFLSGSPRLIEEEVREVLAQFPAHELTLRRHRESLAESFDFKRNAMARLYESSTETFILIGDDTEADPEVYADFAAKKPGQILAIYIRRVTGRPLPAGSIPFVTAYDVARNEVAAGRMTEEHAKAVGEAVLRASDKQLLPRFHECPAGSPNGPQPAEGVRINRRIAKLCAARSS